MFDPNTCVELRVLGPEGKPYIDLENKYTELFKNHEAHFIVPLLFSSPPRTNVALAIGIGVLTGAGIHLVSKLIDELFFIQESQSKTEIQINIQNGDKYIFINGSKSEIVKQLKDFEPSNVE